MKTHCLLCLPLAAALMLGVSPVPGAAQSSTPASAPPPAKPSPRPMTPSEMRDGSALPGDLRPERPVTPQISIPLGKKPGAASDARAVRRGNATTPSGINDAVARCEAQWGEQVRAKCRDRIAREARARPPG